MRDAPASLRRWPRRVRQLAIIAVVLLILGFNAIAFVQAWTMTHFDLDGPRRRPGKDMTWREKTAFLLQGPALPRPRNTLTPAAFDLAYETHRLPGYRGLMLEAWRIPATPGAPLVLLFHGYAASKDSTLRAASEFHALGCETWLVDFHGCGGSEGATTSVGFHEAEDVAALARFVAARAPRQPMTLYGNSMGSAAILCAVHRGLVQPDALLLECPFDRLTATVANRFRLIGLPVEPLTHAIVFWGGVQQGFNGLAHNPVSYARAVRCPTLLLQGERDERVGLENGKSIAAALGPRGKFKLFPGVGHAFLVNRAPEEWRTTVRSFLRTTFPTSSIATARR